MDDFWYLTSFYWSLTTSSVEMTVVDVGASHPTYLMLYCIYMYRRHSLDGFRTKIIIYLKL